MFKNPKFRGVNLGGWLVLEKWLTPSLFQNLSATDEYSYCVELGDKAQQILEKHWQTFITTEDFSRIKKSGMNAIRIPIGFWIFGDESPFFGNITYLDWALKEAAKNNLDVIIDLHAAPGSQNGWDHSGKSGELDWPKLENIEKTLKILEKIVKRYSDSRNFLGIELLNEPRWDIPLGTLKDFYERGYTIVRKHCDSNVAVIIHDSFRPHDFLNFMQGAKYENVILDMHLYQCFSEADKNLNIAGHVQKTKVEWKQLIDDSDIPVIIGEWSLGLDPKSLVGLSKTQRDAAVKLYAEVQINTFEHSLGWFFWTWKKESGGGWNMIDSMNKGFLPKRFEKG